MTKLNPAATPTRIGVELGFKHTFDFNSVAANISITDDRREGESLDEAFDRVYNYVEAKLEEKFQTVKAEVEEVYVKPKPKRQGKN